jgi:hypothetical protein
VSETAKVVDLREMLAPPERLTAFFHTVNRLLPVRTTPLRGMRLGLYFGHFFSRMLHICCLTPSEYPLVRFSRGGPNILSCL